MPAFLCPNPAGCTGEVHYGGLAHGRNPDGSFTDEHWYWVVFNTNHGAQIHIKSTDLPDGFIIGDLTTDGYVRCIDRDELLYALQI